VFYAAGPPEAQLSGASRVAVVGGGNSAGQAGVSLARGGALVMLLHRRADLRGTMSDYLVRELDQATGHWCRRRHGLKTAISVAAIVSASLSRAGLTTSPLIQPNLT
jgi:thioredoxin reductase